ncbi:MAG: Multifunctional-autoprocessing repeats-in-toxin [Chlamydiae bacterium]|nr:Multifunctional-autoprocessing repeats-in-toxin [Chlamydiota bacterium]
MEGILEKCEMREGVTFENGGEKIFGVLHRPIDNVLAPVVLIFHGFASSKLGSNRCYVTLAEAFAKEGIASLRIDFRGSGDSEGSLAELSFEDLVSDATASVSFLENLEGIDTSRLGIFGASLGGTLAILSQKKSLSAKALALWAPVASGELWLRDFLQQHPEAASGNPHEALSSYQGIPLHPEFRNQFGQMRAYEALARMPHLPFLHMHGAKDPVITLTHQGAFHAACPHGEFKTYPEAEHSLGFAEVFPDVIRQTIDWFQEHL